MKERPILFSAPMVNALLAGTKTQTRRVVKGDPLELLTQGFTPDSVALPENGLCPYGQPGDRLRVKENAWMWCERRPNGKTKTGRDKWVYVPMRYAPIHYVADHPAKPSVGIVSPETGNAWGWRLKIARFLPAWASRITLEIISVRIERLQDISNNDADAEGTPDLRTRENNWDMRTCFMHLWESIHGPGSWARNPWVWVIEFKRI